MRRRIVASRLIALLALSFAFSSAYADIDTDGSFIPTADGKFVAGAKRYLLKFGADGKLDRKFAYSGLAVLGFPRVIKPSLSVEGPDRSLTVAGTFPGDQAVAAFVRLDKQGNFDPSFGNDGRLGVHFAEFRNASLGAMLVTKDGSLIVGLSLARKSHTAGSVAAVVKFTPKGRIDRTFAKRGVALFSEGTQRWKVQSLAFQKDGKIVVGVNVPEKRTVVIARLKETGEPDTTFGEEGLVRMTPTSSRALSLTALVPLADGKVVGLGAISPFYYRSEILVFRLGANGKPDDGFGDKGHLRLQLGYGGNAAAGFTVDKDGKILVVGQSNLFMRESFVARLGTDGTLDRTFGRGGYATYRFPSYRDNGVAQHVIAQADGGYLIAGTINVRRTDRSHFFLKFDNRGKLVSSFGEKGLQRFPY